MLLAKVTIIVTGFPKIKGNRKDSQAWDYALGHVDGLVFGLREPDLHALGRVLAA